MDPIRGVRRAAHGAWMERVATAGMIARALLQAIIGVSALLLSLGAGGGLLDSKQAAQRIHRQPHGDALLLVLGLGLACYGVWRIAQGVFGHGGPGDSREKVAARRIARAGMGVVYVAFAVSAFQSAAGARDHARTSWVHRVLAWDGGRWVVIAVGVGCVGAGLFQLYRAFTAKLTEELDTRRMSRVEQRWAMRIGRFGLAAHGAVLAILGGILVRAGHDASSAHTRGTSAALRAIASSAWGAVLLPVVAAGFIAYAGFLFVQARYHRDFMKA